MLITLGAVLFLPRYLKTGEGDGFFRPHANPDAQPLAESPNEDEGVVAQPAADATTKDTPGCRRQGRRFRFLHPAAGQRGRAERRADRGRGKSRTSARATECASRERDGAAETPRKRLRHRRRTRLRHRSRARQPRRRRAAATTHPTCCRPAFGASGDAEAVKAKIALLGLNARVESAEIGGKTVYRVRMRPTAPPRTGDGQGQARRRRPAGAGDQGK